jgi:hypothetical protein
MRRCLQKDKDEGSVMGLLDRLLGRPERRPPPPQYPPYGSPGSPGTSRTERTPDEVAIDRYRYLLRTAPPEAIEQAHAEAFAKLTPEQRQQVLAEVSREVPEAERARSDDPASLARMATRAEMREPGTMERVLGRSGGGIGLGGVIAGSLLASVAGAFIGTAIADQLFNEPTADAAADPQAAGGTDPGADTGGTDAGSADAGTGGDFSSGDMGGDFGDIGGF